MFPCLFSSRLVHLAVLESRGTAPNAFAEYTFDAPQGDIECLADGSKTSVLRDKGENVSISFQVQFGRTPVVNVGDKLSEVRTKQGDILFTDGVVRRVSPLLTSDQGIIGRLCSIQVMKA